MKIYVRHGDGELMCPSFRDFQNLYRLKFVAPDDLVRRENSTRWMRAGDLPELRSMHLYDRSGRLRTLTYLLWAMVGVFALAVVVQLFLTLSHP